MATGADGRSVRTQSAAITLKTDPDGRIEVSVAANGRVSALTMRLDPNGALEPVSLPIPSAGATDRVSRDMLEQRATLQTMLARLSLAAQMRASTSFPVRLDVPGAATPVVATLFSTPSGAAQSEPVGFTADAVASTSVDEPHRARSLLAIGAGLAVAAVSHGAGRVAGVLLAATGGAIGNRLGSAHPVPADVTLHIEGREAAGRLETLSATQEVIVYEKRRKKILSDRWSLAAR